MRADVHNRRSPLPRPPEIRSARPARGDAAKLAILVVSKVVRQAHLHRRAVEPHELAGRGLRGRVEWRGRSGSDAHTGMAWPARFVLHFLPRNRHDTFRSPSYARIR